MRECCYVIIEVSDIWNNQSPSTAANSEDGHRCSGIKNIVMTLIIMMMMMMMVMMMMTILFI